jgi:hypothetical protein
MAGQMIAYCGLDCSVCDAYIATQKNDLAALQKMAEEASRQLGLALTAQDSMCDGCIGDGRQIGYCAQCGVRSCAMARGVENCAHCPDYSCETLDAFLVQAVKARANLEQIRRSL